tara:strand:- start:212 stop:838 length:627 start_codon:yes stop_codon:yes gene_type:complete
MVISRKINRINLNEDINIIDNNYLSNKYKKTITYKNVFKRKNILEIFNYNSDNLIPQSELFNNNLNNITEFIYSYNVKKRNVIDEMFYMTNKRTKIYIHIEQLFPRTNIYHIGVTFKSVISNIRYDIRGFNIDVISKFIGDNNQTKLYEKTLFWDYTNKTVEEVVEYEKNMEHKYILGIYDCRHYVRNLTSWASNNPTPVWNLTKLLK